MKTLSIIALLVCSLSVFAKSENLVEIDNIKAELCTKVRPILFSAYNDLEDVTSKITDPEELEYAMGIYAMIAQFQKEICNLEI